MTQDELEKYGREVVKWLENMWGFNDKDRSENVDREDDLPYSEGDEGVGEIFSKEE